MHDKNGLLTPPVRNNLLEPVRPRAVSPDRAMCLPTFSHFLFVNKTALSLSLNARHAPNRLAQLVAFLQRTAGSSEVFIVPQCKVLQKCLRNALAFSAKQFRGGGDRGGVRERDSA